jgi:proprotein convertase subtilisin/kexin type 1
MASTYSSGAYLDQKISSVDLFDKCTVSHTGTSAAAPLAAGIVALMLEANPALTWRDVQHLIVWTSEMAPLRENDGWQTNAAGFRFNPRFGFGLMNAHALVKTSIDWPTVPEKSICTVNAASGVPGSLSSGHVTQVALVSDGCADSELEVRVLEHVEVEVTIEYSRRGALQVLLISPAGTTTQVLAPRNRDMSSVGFKQWRFMSVHTWGEAPAGQWTLAVQDATDEDNSGSILSAKLILHGSRDIPKHMKNGPREYNEVYNLVQNEARSNKLDSTKRRRVGWTELLGVVLGSVTAKERSSLDPELLGSVTTKERRSFDPERNTLYKPYEEYVLE